MRVLLCCSAGASTSLVAEAMRDTLSAEELKNYVIEAKSFDMFYEIYSQYDVILLGPQMRYKKGEVEKAVKGENILIDVIDPIDYAMQNGRKILDHVSGMVLEK